jgi:hypothetical protein
MITGRPRRLREHKKEYHSYSFESVSQICYISLKQPICMAEIEHPERYGWWLNELESLDVNTLQKHGLNNHKEVSDLTEAVKQSLYEDYLPSL